MMDREARRKFIRKVVRFWFKHNLAIAIGLGVVFIATTITVLSVVLSGTGSTVEESELGNVKETTVDDYKGVFDADESESTVRKDRTKTQNVVTTSGGSETVEEIEYSTVLKYNESTRNGYMNNCIFLGDSRTVAMVSYGFVSDENVLAKIGISHPSVMTYTFQQNSGKEYTVSSYLASHKAPVIYIGFGVNGMVGISEEKYEKTYKDMIESIMKLAPDSEIVIMAIGPVDDNGPYKKTCQNSVIEKYNAFLRTLAEYEGIYYLDVDTVLKGSNGQIKPEYDAGDGLHYKACAYTVILEYLIHHPVPGISDEGEFVVKYVKPSGQFKTMMKDTTALPENVEVVEQLPATNQEITPVVEYVPTLTPTPTPKPEQPQQQPQQPVVDVKPTLSPSPTPSPTVNVPQAGVTSAPEPPVETPAVVPPEAPPQEEQPTPPQEEQPTPEPQPEQPPEPQPGDEPQPGGEPQPGAEGVE